MRARERVAKSAQGTEKMGRKLKKDVILTERSYQYIANK